VREFDNPVPMTIDEALDSPNPAFEIALRLGRSNKQPMTDVESLFYEASYVLGDILNGGLDQCLSNSAGDYFDSAVKFAEGYCDPGVAAALRKVERKFPNSAIPKDRIVRQGILEALTSKNEGLFDALDTEFYGLEALYIEGLLNLAKNEKAEFVNLDWEGKDA
jgi:hypothetical protein